MASAAFLKATPRPTVEQIQKAMTPWLCRCGTHHRIVAAIQQASKTMA
jgi:nicotinate dehydrogenase subunit A